MSDVELVLRSTRVITPEGTRAASVAVSGGTIVDVRAHDAPVEPGARLEDVGDHALLPGLVDTHVHVNDPGRTEWEGFWTATRAAAAGGITTLVDMPLNSLPPTTTVDHLRTKQGVARPKAHIDVGFWGGALPDNVKDLRPLHDAGVYGFKCFLSPSGVDEFPELDHEQLAASMGEIAGFGGLLIVHAEDPRELAAAPARGGPKYADYLATRPRVSEDTAIEGLIALAQRIGARVHVLHLSSSDALPLIAAAKREGVRLTVETCPHYLTLTAEEVPDGASEFKCCPPIREAANQDLLWQALADGTIDCVVTDHSPSTADLKTADFATAWGGISGLQLSLPAVWTAARARGHGLEDVVRWMSTHTARLVGLDRKGAIEPGRDADFAVLAPDETFTVDPARLQHRNRVTAYAGKTLSGVVKSTWLRGRRIVSEGEFTAPSGRLLERKN
ncbi:allantoinase AllB [Streptomyces spectabilis]|uniref:allantoinase n=1 Tax=Streptomyces spectabilis TaxID=68270 RepID=A0A5P2XEH0_STRST|nr:allantoinase AllB [Streptomyces spectabilis]MBB5109286.1 allantoinase [Streptomyces spectabilis]MCI3905976.1 allantoinase AllB [Streptomyces spectabilis]QEV62881.1 allantoinase AllB [Streptomyces spectabilis]GGV05585.1 allantoinase [Streptomyces spectabilis]